MVSSIAWLDTSADEQRRVRELIALFTQPESRDELGIGQVRQVLSDTLFPGTTVLLTRARYFLIVPWTYRYAATKERDPAKQRALRRATERDLVTVLQKTDHLGVIGRVQGRAVKNLPSTIYWAGLQQYGILRDDTDPEQLTLSRSGRESGSDELAERSRGSWHPTLPDAPIGFPHALPGGLDLAPREAQWLRERILASVPDTLLSHLVTADRAPAPAIDLPWHDPLWRTAPDQTQDVLRHAELFSFTMHGASLLYNVMVARRYEAAGHNRVVDAATRHEQRYRDWLEEADSDRRRLREWNLDRFWAHVTGLNARISWSTRTFVNDWISAVLDGSAQGALDDPRARQIVDSRERRLKKSQSRLINDRLLASWSGDSGSGALNYRWPTVRAILADIHQGLSSPEPTADRDA